MSKTKQLTGEIIKSLTADVLCDRGSVPSMDFNEIRTPGVYLITKLTSMENGPAESGDYASLTVYPGYYPIQEVQPTTATYFLRRINTGSSWRPWIKYSGTATT